MKRSSWASGSGYVPSYSTGFCVAHTMNIDESGMTTPSIVTCRSSIPSSIADCVFGGVRLISSASSRSVKIGPRRVENSPLFGLNTVVPTTSDGMRSGVNWMRRNSTPSNSASALTRSVFAVPGTPSMSAWPWPSKAKSRAKIESSWPTTTLRRPSWRRRATSDADAGMRREFLSKSDAKGCRADELGFGRSFVRADPVQFHDGFTAFVAAGSAGTRGDGAAARALGETETDGGVAQARVRHFDDRLFHGAAAAEENGHRGEIFFRRPFAVIGQLDDRPEPQARADAERDERRRDDEERDLERRRHHGPPRIAGDVPVRPLVEG